MPIFARARTMRMGSHEQPHRPLLAGEDMLDRRATFGVDAIGQIMCYLDRTNPVLAQGAGPLLKSRCEKCIVPSGASVG